MTENLSYNVRQIWERYSRECHKYDMPRLTAVHNIVHGRTTHFQMNDYCTQTIAFWLAFETFAAHQQICIVTHIDASNSPFSESACHSLNDLLETSRRLEYLNLTNCGIGHRGIAALEEGLQYMNCITYLNLSGCQMRDDGGVIVAAAFRNNVTCIHLDLGHNLLDNAAGCALGDMLERNDCLEELELGWNNLHAEEECVVPLLKGVRKNTGLKRLGLAWNAISGDERVVETMLVMLVKNRTLELLNLENNRITCNMNILADGLRRSTLRSIQLGGNPLTPQDITVILTTLAQGGRPMRFLKQLSLGKYQWIDRTQANVMQKLLAQNYGRLQVEYAGVMLPNPPLEVDFKKLLMARIRTLAAKPKKAKLKRDIGQFFLQLQGEEPQVEELDGQELQIQELPAEVEKECTMDEWMQKCKEFGGKIDSRLYEQIASEWMDKKKSTVLLLEMAAYYLAIYPTKRVIVPPKPIPAKPKGKDKKKKK